MEARLGLIRLGFREDVSEKGLQDRHAAADETGVDFDHTVGNQRSEFSGTDERRKKNTSKERSLRPAMSCLGR